MGAEPGQCPYALSGRFAGRSRFAGPSRFDRRSGFELGSALPADQPATGARSGRRAAVSVVAPRWCPADVGRCGAMGRRRRTADGVGAGDVVAGPCA